MEEMIQWKLIWKLSSGIYNESPNSVVLEKLLEVKDDLRNGLLHFKKNTETSDAELNKLLKSSDQEKLFPFAKQLQNFLDLNSSQTWSILCTYLVNEYRGSPNSLSIYVLNESNKWKLINDIWNYYCLERMVMLKLIKNMLEYHNDKRHPYHEEYKKVLEKMDWSTLKKSLFKQLSELMKEEVEIHSGFVPAYGIVDTHLNDKRELLYHRNIREINELLHLLLLVNFHHNSVTGKDLKDFLELFKTTFRQPQSGKVLESSLLQRIELSKVAILLFLIENTEPNMKNWEKDIRNDVEELIVTNHQTFDCGPILLSWMVKNLKFQNVDGNTGDSLPRNYLQLGNKSIQLKVFRYLYHMIRDKMFNNKPSNLLAIVVRKVIYKLLDDFCVLFDEDGSVSQQEFVYDLLAELLVTPSIASNFIKDFPADDIPEGCYSLYNTSLSLFPAEFINLSKVISALSLSGVKSSPEFIRSQISSLPVFTATYMENQYDLQPNPDNIGSDEFILMRDYYPLKKFNYKIPRGTNVVIIDRKNVTYVHFKHNINYYDVLHNDILEILSMSVLGMGDMAGEKSYIERVTHGIVAVKNIVSRLKSPSEITDSMVHPVELVFDLLVKLKTVQQPPIELLANCLEVCALLLRFFDEEITKRVLNLNILPSVTNDTLNFQEYAKGMSFDPGLVGQYLISFETSKGRYQFLKAYFSFLKNYSEVKSRNIFAVELPGLIFLLREIFPHCHSWRFEAETDLHEIYIFVMEYLFDILQSNQEGSKLLRDITVSSLLNLENGLILLKFVGIGNPFLQSKMENETNWVAAINSGLTNIIRLSMTILMQILRQKSEVLKDSGGNRAPLSPLETVIYTQPKQRDNLRIIPVVTSYINNIFNRRLPVLSCRLLRRFAIEFQMSLLACLDMEPDHIRMIFLQRLRDELSSNELKIAILEFVESCLDKQPGLIEAFFDVKYETKRKKLKKDSKFHTEGIPSYMDEYLEAVSKDPEKIASPLLSRIMSLFHAVWRNNMQSLIGDLTKQPTFWSSLCKPFFVPISHKSIRAYSQLFNILGIEVFGHGANEKLDKNLEEMLEKLFSVSVFGNWVDFVFDVSQEQKTDDDLPEWLCRLQSFKDFLVVMMKKQPNLFTSQVKGFLLNKIITVLVLVSSNTTDWRPLVTIGELYLTLLLNNDGKKHTANEKEDKILFENMAKLMSFLASAYEDVIPRARDAILGSMIQLLVIFNADIGLYPEISTGLVQSSLTIICLEIYKIQNGATPGSSNSVIIASNMLRKLLLINEEKRFFDWYSMSNSFKVVYRILSVVEKLCHNYVYRLETCEFLDLLVVLVNTTESNEFLNCDVSDYLWLKLLPPKVLLQTPAFNGNGGDKNWTLQDWWKIYAKGMELVSSLLHKYEHSFAKEAINFIGIHEENISESIFLVKESLEPDAMKLIRNALELIYESVKYKQLWQLEHQQSLFNIMRCVQYLMEYLISLLYRPNLLKMLLDGRQNNVLMDLTAPVSATPELITAMNKVIELIILCAKCLLAFSPSLYDLICEQRFTPSQWHALIEIQFGAPKLNEAFRQLSFGTLMSAVGTFTKCLNLMHYNFNEKPLNFETEIKETSSLEVSPQKQIITSTVSSPRTPYGKALSVSSYGNTQSNEILASLEGDLCLSALENVATLLLSQSYLALKDGQLSMRDKQLIRRELSTELNIFHDLVKKRLGLDFGSWQRKKRASIDIVNELEEDQASSSKSPQAPKRQSNSLRVNVVRKLHIQQVQMRGSTPRKEASDSFASFENITPIKRSDKSQLNVNEKRTTDDDIEYLEPEESGYTGLSKVKIVEEDYLQFLSNIFLTICHSEK